MDLERLPPQDQTAEVALIGSVLLLGTNGEPTPQVARVPTDAFWNGSHARMWLLLQNLSARGLPLDVILVHREASQLGLLPEIGGDHAVATYASGVTTPAHADHYADVVLGLWRRRTIMFACEEVARGLTNGLDIDGAGKRIAEAMAVSAAASTADFQTAASILSSLDHDMAWLTECLVPDASLVALCGEPKVGKTVFISRWLSAALNGRGRFIGLACREIPAAVWLSEESPTTLRAPLQAAGLTDDRLHLLTRSDMRRSPWRDSAAAAVEKCIATKSPILIVDTFAAWAALQGEEENQVGPVQAALQPLQEATTKGISVILTHHLSKDPGRQGVSSIRGSSSFAGAVDGFLLLRREGPQDSPLRSLYGAGRGDGWANGIRYELDPDGSLRRVDGKGASIAAALGPAILREVAANPGCSTGFLHRAVGGNKADFLLAMEALQMDGKVTFEGGSEGTAKRWKVI